MLHEPEVLKKLFGYSLYKQFLAGIQEVVVAQKWIDLLYGKDYTDARNVLQRWNGLISYTDGSTIGTYQPEDRVYVVGGVGVYDPIVDGTEINDPFLVGKNYRLIERGTGPLTKDNEWETTLTGLELIADSFEVGGVYTIEFLERVPLPAPAVVTVAAKQSLIANYVYYKYMFDQATVVTGSGKKVIAAQNAIATNEQRKEVEAWNTMVSWNLTCIEFLRANATAYSYVYDFRCKRSEIFQYKNTLGV